jgi:hypothetical protein
MRITSLGFVVAVGVLGVGIGCKGPQPPNPLDNQSRYLCCNVWYEHDEINDVLYQWGTKIPFGTRVQILKVGKDFVKFQAEGHPAIKLELRYGAKVLTIDDYVNRIFVVDDPRAKLKKVPAKTVKQIEEGQVAEGMTRDQVLMAVGYPPAHRTPSLSQSDWHLWQNHWHQWLVNFEGDKVVSVQR